MVDSDKTRQSSSDEEGEDTDGSTARQLQTLKSLIPNATSKTDKRSILEEAHDYLLRIHEETEQIEKEHVQTLTTIFIILFISCSFNTADHYWYRQSRSEDIDDTKFIVQNNSSRNYTAKTRAKRQVEVEELMERRFVVKICWRNDTGVAAHVQRVIECLDVKMTSIDVQENTPDEMLTTAFIKVKKDIKMTEEEIYNLIRNAAARFGLL